MSMSLHTLSARPGTQKSKQRIGRGLGRKGTTSGRGQKGQSSRTGVGGLKRLGMRKLILSTPKLRGFRSLESKSQAVNLEAISKSYIAGEVVSPKTLMKKGLIADQHGMVKVLAGGAITVAVTVKGCQVSKAAAEKISAAGGSVA